MGVEVAGETTNLTGQLLGETQRVPEHSQKHPQTRESAPEGPNLLVGRGGSN